MRRGHHAAQGQGSLARVVPLDANTPCIAICSTSQGDEICKGCGRSFDEVQFWPEMTPAEKRAVWRRITMQGTAWRFNRYAERAREAANDHGLPADSTEAARAQGSGAA